MSRASLRADLMAGITVALVLVPQSMAYAQLAGLPVFYGLYASFVPVIIASLWGSSSQLHTGPVAMLSLMSAAAVIPFAAPGSDRFIEISVMLALMVGVMRLALGALMCSHLWRDISLDGGTERPRISAVPVPDREPHPSTGCEQPMKFAQRGGLVGEIMVAVL